MLPIALFIFGIGGPVKSVKCVQKTTGAPVQVCTVVLRSPAANGDRITLIHSGKDPLSSASTTWEFGRNGYEAGVISIDLYESPETEVVGVRYDGRGKTKPVK
jgi:hypothetical protein